MIFVEKIFNKTTFLKFVSSIELIFGLLCFFYILSPYRFWEKSVIPNQLEIITKSFYLLNFQLLLTFFKKTLVKSNSQIIIKLVFADVFLLLYVLYHYCPIKN